MHEICVEFPWWCMTIFGAVDGFSRLPVSLECVSNNKSETLQSCFTKGVQTYGIPSRVRPEKGRENVLIRHFMTANRGPEHGSLICGKSSHSQRIERLWRDVYNGVTGIYHEFSTLSRMKKFLTPSMSLIWQHFITCFCLLLMTRLMSGDRHGPNIVCEQ